MKAILAGVAFGLLMIPAAMAQNKVANAQPGDLRVLVMAAYKGPLETVLPQAKQVLGKTIMVEYGGSRSSLRDTILGGQDFEVAVMLPDVNDELIKLGKVLPERTVLAQVPIAIGLRGDVPVMDVSTPAALKAAMLKAKSIKYAPTGAAVDTVKNIFAKLAIGDKIKDSSALKEEVPLGPGEYEINIFPFSEIAANPKLKNLGPVMASLQIPISMEAVIGAHANDPKAAHALIAFLTGPAIDAGLAKDHMIKGGSR